MSRPRTTHMTPPIVDRRRPGLVWPVRCDPCGVDGPTPAQARGPCWWSPTRGLYLPVGLAPELTLMQRIVTAAALLPPGGAVTGWAALAWMGARHLDGRRGGRELPVPLAVPGRVIRQRPGIELTTESDLTASVREVDGLMVTAPAPATAYAARTAATLVEAVALIDRTAAADLASLAELREVHAAFGGLRGVVRLGDAIDLADENCWSPTETTMRLVWRDLGVTNVVCNRPVFDLAGNLLGTPDLIDLDHGVAGEYDGELHLAGERRAADIRREGLFRRAGLEYVTMVAADLRRRDDFCQRTRDAIARSATLERRWTIQPPPWWTETHTVDRRRALSDWERARYLRWQGA